MSLNATQSLDEYGPYYVTPGEPFGMSWIYVPGGNVFAFATLQTDQALNTWFFIENTAIMTQGNVTDENHPNNYTNYAINITNGAPPNDDGEYLEVILVVLSFTAL